MHRRTFLHRAGQLTAAAGLGLGASTWFARSQASPVQDRRLIVIFLRGAVDGLSLLVPHQEAAYYEARPTIAIPPPGQPGGAVDLNGEFGLHPQLAMLLPLWEQKSLAFVQGCGLPMVTRSHFDAQEAVESGTPGNQRTGDGWMNRLLALLAQGENPIQALNIGNATPRILAGPSPVASLASGRAASQKLSLDRDNVAQAFDRLYTPDSILGPVYQEARAARQALEQASQAEMMAANNGAPLPQGFVGDAQRLARIMAQDMRVQLAFMGLGGWDTHLNQGASEGQLARNFKLLGQGLVALQTGLGRQFRQTSIVVMSEFGRTVLENGNGGTDHGYGNVMMLLGGGLEGSGLEGLNGFRGQTIYGDWAGLELSQRHEARDLPVTTDFREVLTRILSAQLKLKDNQIAQVFPDYRFPDKQFPT